MTPITDTPNLTDHEIDVLAAMDINDKYMSLGMIATVGGFKRRVSRGTVKRLKRLGYLKIGVLPVEGHEQDYMETGHYYTCIKKVKDVDPDPKWMARRLAKLAAECARCGSLLIGMRDVDTIIEGGKLNNTARKVEVLAHRIANTKPKQ